MSRRPFTPKVVTANDLRSGDVVYLDASGAWVSELRYAVLIDDPAEAKAKLQSAAAQDLRVVGVYLADVTAGAHGPEPVHFREAFRATGPSNYPSHGKQARLS